MIRTLFFGCLLLACLFSTAHAQTNAPPDTTALKRHKWEIAADLLSLTSKNDLPPASLLLRYNLTTRKGKHHAIRLRVGADYRQEYQDDYSPPPIQTRGYVFVENYMFYGRLGYEWQKTIKRFQHYWGLDAQVQFDKLNLIRQDVALSSSDLATKRRINQSQVLRVGGVGFIGMKYFITPRFALSGEANVEFYRAWQHDKIDYITTPVDLPKDRKEFRNDFWVLNFNTLYVVQLSYLFR